MKQSLCPGCLITPFDTFGEYAQCPTCGHVEIDGAPNPALYDRAYLAHYEALNARDVTFINRIRLLNIMAFTCPTPARPTTLLDFGCGTGSFVDLANAHDFIAYGYDINPTSKFTDPSVLNEKYDIVVAWDVIEHLPDERTLFDLVSNGGFLVISTPDARALPADPRESHHFKPGEHLRIYSPASLRNLLDLHGFVTRSGNSFESTIRWAGEKPFANIMTIIATRDEEMDTRWNA